VKNHGPSIYFDTSAKDTGGKKRHNVWRADITVNEKRHRKRGNNKEALRRWLKDIKNSNTQGLLGRE
jgi:hypothetical protein